METSIQATELPLNKVFCSDFVLQVPSYQRPYAWTTDQAHELLEDVQQAMSEEEQDKSQYFLGSIVLAETGCETEYEIVDGQQRLTTLTILFSVLRDLSKSEECKRELNALVVEEGAVLKEIKKQYRLKIRERDRGFFEKHILKKGAVEETIKRYKDLKNKHISNSIINIFSNAKYFWDVLKYKSDEECFELAKFLAIKCILVVVTASTTEAAYRIFATLNSRGLDLSPTDILKAEVISSMQDAKQEDATKRWENIEGEIGRSQFQTLFSHIYMIKQKQRPPKGLVRGYREDIFGRNAHQQPVEAFIDNVLEPYANQYKFARLKEYYTNNTQADITKFLKYMQWIDNQDWVPVVMECVTRWPTSTQGFTRAIADIERRAFSFFVRRVYRGPRISHWGKILKLIDESADLADLFKEDNKLQLSSEEKQETIRSLNSAIPSKVRRPLLRRLNAMNKDGDVDRLYRVSVEHVLPQKPRQGSTWLKEFPNEKDRIEWTNCIANLVLLSGRKNSKASNYDFQRKKDEYFRKGNVTPFALTSEVLDEHEWTLATLERRQADLLGRLKKEWRLD